MTAVIEARGLGKTLRAALGPDRLHARHPRRAGRRPGRSERGRQDDLAAPRRRPACSHHRHDRGARRRAGGWIRRNSERVGFVAQETPLYPGLSVGDHLRLGAWLNPGLGPTRWPGAGSARSVSISLSGPGGCREANGPSSPSPWRSPSARSC